MSLNTEAVGSCACEGQWQLLVPSHEVYLQTGAEIGLCFVLSSRSHLTEVKINKCYLGMDSLPKAAGNAGLHWDISTLRSARGSGMFLEHHPQDGVPMDRDISHSRGEVKNVNYLQTGAVW